MYITAICIIYFIFVVNSGFSFLYYLKLPSAALALGSGFTNIYIEINYTTHTTIFVRSSDFASRHKKIILISIIENTTAGLWIHLYYYWWIKQLKVSLRKRVSMDFQPSYYYYYKICTLNYNNIDAIFYTSERQTSVDR